jgi:hypothetical protein
MLGRELAVRVAVLAASATVWCVASTAYALPVQVDVGGYAGQYRVDGVPAVGSRVFDLAPGGHVFSNQSESGFSFVVGADGTIASVNNAVAATFVGTTLALANASVAIEPGGYVGRYVVTDVIPSTPRVGPTSVVVIPGLRSRINNGSFIGGSELSYRVGADGSVESLSPDSAEASGSTLLFRNTTITIDPQAYTGNYATVLSDLVRVTGLRSFVAIPAQRYSIELGASLGGSGFIFDVSATGIVSTTFVGGHRERSHAHAEEHGSDHPCRRVHRSLASQLAHRRGRDRRRPIARPGARDPVRRGVRRARRDVDRLRPRSPRQRGRGDG